MDDSLIREGVWAGFISRPRPRGRVLVVDDDAATRSGLARLLEAEGIATVTAGDGREALERIGEEVPILVVSDVRMPVLDGVQLCQRLKNDPETRLIPVLLVTGLDSLEDRVHALDAGADDFVSKPFERAELLARVRSMVRMKRYVDELERIESVLVALGRALEERDAETEGHCQRLADLASHLGTRLGLDDETTRALRLGGFLHDIGKVAIPDAILRKTGPLTPDERLVIKRHPEIGERICGGLRSLTLVRPIIRHHHERRDGTGYPDGLAGEDIPVAARVLQVVDVYDALTTTRPYRPALAPTRALEIMREEVDRGWWDPDVFAAFGAMMAAGIGSPPKVRRPRRTDVPGRGS